MYLLTNEKCNLIGVYELSMKRMSFQTGIEMPAVKKILAKFEADGKISYHANYVVMLNYLRYQNTNNTNIRKGVVREYELLPEQIKSHISLLQDSDKVHISLSVLNLTKPNLTQLNTDTNNLFSVDECKAVAEYEGYKAEEGQKFFDYYNAQGWKKGKSGLVITDLTSAFRAWLNIGKELKLNGAAKETFEDRAKKLAEAKK